MFTSRFIFRFCIHLTVSKQKEAEMAMWKRRSKYDPMKAAAEDKRKKEEAKRLAQAQQLGVVGMPSERYVLYFVP